MIKYYYQLTKPGIIYGNVITAAAGFFLAAQGEVNWFLFFLMLIGISLVIASGCVFNNYIDRDIDALMERTKNRELVLGIIAPQSALYFGAFLGGLGFLILNLYTNGLTFFIALVGFFFYVVVYSLWAKRGTVFGTIIGSIPGAVPITAGYVAGANTVDLGALLLFFVLVFWQMPHSYAIGVYRFKDYAKANIPVLPVKSGIRVTKFHIIFWIIAFVIMIHQLHYYHYAGNIYFLIMLPLSLLWFSYSVYGFWVKDDTVWAKRMFLLSILVLLVFSVTISL